MPVTIEVSPPACASAYHRSNVPCGLMTHLQRFIESLLCPQTPGGVDAVFVTLTVLHNCAQMVP